MFSSSKYFDLKTFIDFIIYIYKFLHFYVRMYQWEGLYCVNNAVYEESNI